MHKIKTGKPTAGMVEKKVFLQVLIYFHLRVQLKEHQNTGAMACYMMYWLWLSNYGWQIFSGIARRWPKVRITSIYY